MKKARATQPPFELWQTAHTWLKACGSKPNSNFCKEEITTRPDYPSLLSLIDFLDSGGIDYKAVQADASYIHEFNYPLIAHIKQPGDERMYIINDATEWDKQKEITQHWSGITVYPGKNAQWQNEQNIIYQRNENKNKFIAVALSLTGIALFVLSIFKFPDLLINTFGLLSLSGLIISIFALGTELGFQSELVKQVCGTVSKGGCEKVLKSNYAKGFAGITPADLSVLYFAAQCIIYLLGCIYQSYLQSILLFAFGGIAIAALSIYTQAAILKQWCALYLGIVAVLVLQTIISFTAYSGAINYRDLLLFCVLLSALSVPLLSVKQLIKTNSTNKIKLAELKKWKLDGNLFISQWQQEQEVDTTIWQNDLLLGHLDAPLQITVACNPYCGPCAKAHKQLDELLVRFDGKLKVQVRFLCRAEDESDKLTIAVKAILQKAVEIKNNTELQQMLTDWFKWMDEDKWRNKWHHSSPFGEWLGVRLLQHSKWIKESHIAFTPTFFINGKKLPSRYALSDLEILIPQLIETIKQEV